MITRLMKKDNIVMEWINGCKLNIIKGRPASTANYYVGMSDFETMGFLCHFLRREDTLCDVGANVGIYTVLGSCAIGVKTVSIEPEESALNLLRKNLEVNQCFDNVEIVEAIVGEKEGIANFTTDLDAINHVAVSQDRMEKVKQIQVKTLDHIFVNNVPIILKIDVEGYETAVLKGATSLLNNQSLKGIMIELNGLGKRYGYEDINIYDSLLSYGFKSYNYDPINRQLMPIQYSKDLVNSIFVREIEFVKKRLQESMPFTIGNKSF